MGRVDATTGIVPKSVLDKGFFNLSFIHIKCTNNHVNACKMR